jgi:hypothetical protein
MTGNAPDRLYHLLPEIYRIRDAESGESLRALLGIIGDEVKDLEEDIDGLYRNLFIETCDNWVVPYIGDLIGTRTLYSIPSADFSMRGFVANTLAYRRRKGTATSLEQLARDVTGWPARVVEYYRLLAMTQHLNHIRPDFHSLADIGDGDALDLLGGPFEETAHSVDVRHISNRRGRYNIPDIGIFLWRLQSYPVTGGSAYKIEDVENHWYTFSPIGLPVHLFNNPRTEREITHIAEEINLPVELRRKALSRELERYRSTSDQTDDDAGYFSSSPVFSVYRNGNRISPELIRIGDLGEWNIPADLSEDVELVVDPVIGRLFFVVGTTSVVTVDYSYGFSGGIGGGSYNHLSAIVSPDPVNSREKAWDLSGTGSDSPADVLAAWKTWDVGLENSRGIITITDSLTYLAGDSIEIDFCGRKKGTLIIQAADEQRPVLDGSITIIGSSPDCSLVLNGLLIHGTITVEPSSLGSLTLMHCTLTPGGRLNPETNCPQKGEPSIYYGGITPASAMTDIIVDHCITGALCLPADRTRLIVKDSIIQAFPRQKFRPVFTSRVTGAIPQEAAFISTLENMIAQSDGPCGVISPASVMVIEDHVVVIPATGTAVPHSALHGLQESLNNLLQDQMPAGSSAFCMTSAVLGNPASMPVEAGSGTMNVRVTVRGAGTAVSAVITLEAGEINTGPGTAIWDLLQKAIRAAGDAGSPFSAIIVGCWNGATIAFHPTDQPDGIVYEILFSETDADQISVYYLGLVSGTPVAISGENGCYGPESDIMRTTIFGEVWVKGLSASGVIFNDIVTVEKNQEGCVRFSYVPQDSVTPRRYRCQPDLALERENAYHMQKGLVFSENEKAAVRSRMVPRFTSVHYRDPGYSQLGRTCAKEICSGGEDGSEMGAFSFLLQPQREANLRAVLDEYLRFGLEAGIFYVT